MKKYAVKTLGFIRENIIALSVILLVIVIGTICLVSLSGKGEPKQTSWPENDLTKGVPAFSGTPVSVTEEDNACAVYFTGIHREEADAYASELESALSVSFDKESYPRSAVCSDILITLHYNASEMDFSVTFAAKDNTETSDPEVK